MLALMKYGDMAASARQRLLQFRPFLARANIEVECLPLLDNEYLRRTFRQERAPLMRIGRAYLERLVALLLCRDFDILWVQYEVFPYLIGLAENFAFIGGKPIVCDFDDAIHHQYDNHSNPLVRLLLGRKLEPLLRGAELCICGNAYIKAYAERLCRRTEIVPTVLDIAAYVPRVQSRGDERPVTVGWIGSPSTWTFVKPLIPLLRTLADELNLMIRIVGAGPSDGVDSSFKFVGWSEDTEIGSIQSMDIGIMPLPDEPWARGKCGYKLIQYMACGIPVIASPVGVNSEMVHHGGNGFLARNEQQWEDAIRCLAASAEVRANMGAQGRKKAVAEYSLDIHGPRLAGLLHSVMSGASV